MDEKTKDTISSDRDANIDLLKIIACIAVVGLHTLGNIGLICGFAVPTFILSSGYLLLRRNSVTLNKTVSRILRILKIIVLWALLWLSFPQLFLSSPGWVPPKCLTIIKCISDSLIQKGIWQFWYFGTLIGLYLMLFFLDTVKKRIAINYNQWIYNIWGVTVFFGVFLQEYSYFYLHYPAQSIYVQTFRFWTWVQYFMMGGLLYQHKEYFIRKIPFNINAILVVLFSALSWMIQFIGGTYFIHNLQAEYFYDDIIIVVWVFLIALFVLRLKIQRNQTIYAFSKLTLGVYIIHPFLLEWYVKLCSIVSAAEHIMLFLVLSITSFSLVFLMTNIPIIKELVTLENNFTPRRKHI